VWSFFAQLLLFIALNQCLVVHIEKPLSRVVFLRKRSDLIGDVSPPLNSDVVVAGPVSVDLWISSSARDTDFTAKLVDVSPPSKDYPFGFAMNTEDRIIRVRWSNGYDKPEFLKPGEIRKATVDLISAGIWEAMRLLRYLEISAQHPSLPRSSRSLLDLSYSYYAETAKAINRLYRGDCLRKFIDRLNPT
jgi:hypothetical protein